MSTDMAGEKLRQQMIAKYGEDIFAKPKPKKTVDFVNFQAPNLTVKNLIEVPRLSNYECVSIEGNLVGYNGLIIFFNKSCYLASTQGNKKMINTITKEYPNAEIINARQAIKSLLKADKSTTKIMLYEPNKGEQIC